MKLKSQMLELLWLLTRAASSTATETECQPAMVLAPSYVLASIGLCALIDPGYTIHKNIERLRRIDVSQITGQPTTSRLRVLVTSNNGLVVMSECEDYPRVSTRRITYNTDIMVILSVCGLSSVPPVVYITLAAFNLIDDLLEPWHRMYSIMEDLPIADFRYDLKDVGIPISGLEDSMKLALSAELGPLSKVWGGQLASVMKDPEYGVRALFSLYNHTDEDVANKMVRVNYVAVEEEMHWKYQDDIQHTHCIPPMIVND